jgi:hypothetical protein
MQSPVADTKLKEDITGRQASKAGGEDAGLAVPKGL